MSFPGLGKIVGRFFKKEATPPKSANGRPKECNPQSNAKHSQDAMSQKHYTPEDLATVAEQKPGTLTDFAAEANLEPALLRDFVAKANPGLTLTPDEIDAVRDQIIALLKKQPNQLARIDIIRRVLAISRFLRLSSNLQSFESDPNQERVRPGTLIHNQNELAGFCLVERPGRLLLPLFAIDRVYLDRANLKVLIVGPRTEMELIQYISYGFSPENISCLDLFSYSPFVDIGDMHSMPYSDDSFDIIVVSQILGYSKECRLAATEIVRVGRTGALVGSAEDWTTKIRYSCPEGPIEYSLESTQQILDLFGHSVGRVILRNEPDPAYPLSPLREPSAVITIFEIAKAAAFPNLS
jgi:hypothetical protein